MSGPPYAIYLARSAGQLATEPRDALRHVGAGSVCRWILCQQTSVFTAKFAAAHR